MSEGWGGLDREAVSFAAHRGLHFSGPYGEPAVAELLAAMTLPDGADVLDVGCGDGELLLRVLFAGAGAAGTGVDPAARGLGLARTRAEELGLADRATFVAAPVAEAALAPAASDLVMCVGATHAFGGTDAALTGCRALARPAGLVLVGEGFWERPPTPAALAALQAEASELGDLAALELQVAAAELTVEWMRVSSQDEWDAYEDAWSGNLEEQAGDFGDQAGAVRRFTAARRAGYRDGYRSVLGFVLLLLRRAG